MKLLVLFIFTLGSVSAAESVKFNRDIRPVLSDRCFHCHGPDEHDRKAHLRLDQAEGDDGAFRNHENVTAIVPGSLEKSELWRRIISDDEEEVMPPADSHKKALTDKEKQLFKQWIKEGAGYEQFWAFVPPEKPEKAKVKNQKWSQEEIDLFVMRKLESEGLQAKSRADRRTLIRRLSFDLTGLPPTREEIAVFLKDEKPDAWKRLVDQFLAKPQYGEHMAKYWLDLVRFADTNGIHHDHYRDLSSYRDWVIRAFNQNLPYDQFLTYQLAGDLFPNPTTDQLVASGFHRLHLIIDRGTMLPEESFARNVIDRVESVGTAFLGLTVQCAVCHDHKYDPLTSRDFYQLFAFFNNIDAAPETGGRSGSSFKRGLQDPYIEFLTPEQEEKRAEWTKAEDDAKSEVARLKEQIAKAAKVEAGAKSEVAQLKEQIAKATKAEAGAKSEVARLKEQVAKAAKGEADAKSEVARLKEQIAKAAKAEVETKSEVAQLKEQIAKAANSEKSKLQNVLKATEGIFKKIQADKINFELVIPAAMVMKEREEIRPAHMMIRGAYDNLGEEVVRNTPGFLPPMKAGSPEARTRMDLAKWFVAPENPLTGRVAVNRFWQQLFGVGIVKTSEDLGAQGEWPSHPDLLDYLTSSFIKNGWNIKALLREMVMSETYCQSSEASPEEFNLDPDNRMLSRGSRFRLESEAVRDQILATSGLLNKEMYGKSVKPPQPLGLWKAVSLPSSYPSVFTADSGDKTLRRSVYTFWKRGLPPPQMTILNAPTRESCTARRERTNTPLQALLLLNEEEYFKAARNFAARVLQEAPENRMAFAYETITSKLPDKKESASLAALLADLEKRYRENPALTAELTKDGKQIQLAAWTIVINTLFNLDITKTRQ